MSPSIDTGECEKKVVEVVNTEELPLNAAETGEEAKAKPEDLIAEEENKNDKTEESAETENIFLTWPTQEVIQLLELLIKHRRRRCREMLER